MDILGSLQLSLLHVAMDIKDHPDHINMNWVQRVFQISHLGESNLRFYFYISCQGMWKVVIHTD